MPRKLLGIILVLVILASVMTGCSSGNKADRAPSTTAGPAMDSGSYNKGEYGVDAPAEAPMAPDADSLAGVGSSPVNVSNAILAERKIIRSANLTIEVENFDKAFANIEGIIANIGFVQQTNINTDRVYIEEEMKLVKSGTIVLRVDKSMFDSVINKLRGLGDVYNYTTDGQDVTDQVVDVESRLRLLKMEQEKLEAYVVKLNDLEEIFKAESKLTEIRYQIESLTGNLNKLNSLVDLSTITINLNEKRPDYNPKPETYGEKLLNSLKESLFNVVEFLGDLLLFIVAALPVLVFIGLCVLFGIWIYRKMIKKRRNDSPYPRGPVYPGSPSANAPYVQQTQPAPTAQGRAPAQQSGAPAQQGGAPMQQGEAPSGEMSKQTDEPEGKQ